MKIIEFFASGFPKGQPRSRAFARKMGSRFVARVYSDCSAEGWKSQIAIAAKQHIPSEPLAGALFVHLYFYFPRPKSHYCAKGLKPTAPKYHTSKPDADNAAKAVLDCLTVLGFWKDEQIARLDVSKFYASSVCDAGANILIMGMEETQ